MRGVLLSDLVRTSEAVSLASGRRVKIDEIAGLLRRAAATIAAETAGASRSCTATPPASTRGAVQARASSRLRPADSWALFASGATWVAATSRASS